MAKVGINFLVTTQKPRGIMLANESEMAVVQTCLSPRGRHIDNNLSWTTSHLSGLKVWYWFSLNLRFS
jgi:hypothetical protein